MHSLLTPPVTQFNQAPAGEHGSERNPSIGKRADTHSGRNRRLMKALTVQN